MNNYSLSGTGELDGTCLCCSQTPGIQLPIRIVAKPLPIPAVKKIKIHVI